MRIDLTRDPQKQLQCENDILRKRVAYLEAMLGVTQAAEANTDRAPAASPPPT
ncbi:hypothetical protein [Paracoccus shanxieyensis]|uniref:Uncharacterized protein n=1 Tax=Paracoccus shanxieyensis TaxID=2675752 RepID=A0A6L6J229_9RHOB|nr:hypothetical protein [Paracoccus shanxieyensis]MTH64757.1 hypothetical protein [Paracoccus shanxieyensis]MTH88010.1 hypothetical protein [Paracoccus shanxieyensis]